MAEPPDTGPFLWGKLHLSRHLEHDHGISNRRQQLRKPHKQPRSHLGNDGIRRIDEDQVGRPANRAGRDRSGVGLHDMQPGGIAPEAFADGGKVAPKIIRHPGAFLDKHAAGEPAQWAKIASPTNTHTWVSARFINPTNKTVLPKKLNLRAGPGENYSVLGVIERGTPVNEIITKNGWTEIETPASTYAFVAAMYLKQEAAAPVETNAAPTVEAAPAPTPTRTAS